MLVGKGITFDSGGISIKPLDGMKLMRKDMGGPPPSARRSSARPARPAGTGDRGRADGREHGLRSAMRPGDVISHYGGKTSEVLNTDAEGRVVLADALAYAAPAAAGPAHRPGHADRRHHRRAGQAAAALFSHDDALAEALRAAATAAGERVWRMPLDDDYRRLAGSDLADLDQLPDAGRPDRSPRRCTCASSPARRPVGAPRHVRAVVGRTATDAELTKGATGWGVRTLVRWLQTTA